MKDQDGKCWIDGCENLLIYGKPLMEDKENLEIIDIKLIKSDENEKITKEKNDLSILNRELNNGNYIDSNLNRPITFSTSKKNGYIENVRNKETNGKNCPNKNNNKVYNEKREFSLGTQINTLQEKNNPFLIKCPKCYCPIEYIGGCNLIRCESPFCNSETYFCLICKKPVSHSSKQQHYPYGILANTCINTIKRN